MSNDKKAEIVSGTLVRWILYLGILLAAIFAVVRLVDRIHG